MNIVLVEPEIPQNTGNIARTCAATGVSLHLIKPLGFELSDRYLKRAGLDYWNLLNYRVYENAEHFAVEHPSVRCFYASTKAKYAYSDIVYRPDDFVFFGRETRGLPETLLSENYDHCIRIPMRAQARSLNLSNSVAVVLYEALRQQGFPGLAAEGALTGSEMHSGRNHLKH